jgi:hypothetical protein
MVVTAMMMSLGYRGFCVRLGVNRLLHRRLDVDDTWSILQ